MSSALDLISPSSKKDTEPRSPGDNLDPERKAASLRSTASPRARRNLGSAASSASGRQPSRSSSRSSAANPQDKKDKTKLSELKSSLNQWADSIDEYEQERANKPVRKIKSLNKGKGRKKRHNLEANQFVVETKPEAKPEKDKEQLEDLQQTLHAFELYLKQRSTQQRKDRQLSEYLKAEQVIHDAEAKIQANREARMEYFRKKNARQKKEQRQREKRRHEKRQRQLAALRAQEDRRAASMRASTGMQSVSRPSPTRPSSVASRETQESRDSFWADAGLVEPATPKRVRTGVSERSHRNSSQHRGGKTHRDDDEEDRDEGTSGDEDSERRAARRKEAERAERLEALEKKREARRREVEENTSRKIKSRYGGEYKTPYSHGAKHTHKQNGSMWGNEAGEHHKQGDGDDLPQGFHSDALDLKISHETTDERQRQRRQLVEAKRVARQREVAKQKWLMYDRAKKRKKAILDMMASGDKETLERSVFADVGPKKMSWYTMDDALDTSLASPTSSAHLHDKERQARREQRLREEREAMQAYTGSHDTDGGLSGYYDHRGDDEDDDAAFQAHVKRETGSKTTTNQSQSPQRRGKAPKSIMEDSLGPAGGTPQWKRNTKYGFKVQTPLKTREQLKMAIREEGEFMSEEKRARLEQEEWERQEAERIANDPEIQAAELKRTRHAPLPGQPLTLAQASTGRLGSSTHRK